MVDFENPESGPIDINRRLNAIPKFRKLHYTDFREHYAVPGDGKTFSRTGFWDSPAVVGTNVPISFQLPEDSEGVLRGFAQYVNDMVAADDITWTIRVNEIAAENWNDVLMFPTLASFRSVGDDPYILLPEGAKVDVLINNRGGLAKKIGAGISGWYWPNRKRVGIEEAE